MPHTARMRTLGQVVVLGLVIRGGLWFFNHEATVLTVLALTVGAYVAVRFLMWFIPGFVRGFRRGMAEQFGRTPNPAEREERYSPR